MSDTEVSDEDDFVAVTKDLVRSKIRFTLSHYPNISPSMLQVGIGTGVPTKFWRPILQEMITKGEVKLQTFSAEHPNGRDQTLKVLSLVSENANVNSPDVRGLEKVSSDASTDLRKGD